MKNTVVERIVNFLNNFPPFSELNHEELIEVAASIRVINLEKNKTLFQVNDSLHEYFYVVGSGSINLSIVSDAEETLLNKCIAGDVLGLRPFFAKNNYMMTAKAREDSIVLAIPINTFKPFIANNSKVLDFLLQSFASTNVSSMDKSSKLLNDTVRISEKQPEIQFFQSLDYNRKPLMSSPNDLVMNVAQKMTDNMFGCVVIHERNFPIGIITDVDLRTKIATGKFQISAAASDIMSSPVITVTENISLAEAQLIMLRHHVTHLCVTADGSNKSNVKGIISQQDLINAQANNPGVLIKEIKKSQNQNDLKTSRMKLAEFIRISINKKIPLNHIMNIVGEVNIALIKKAVDMAILELGTPPARFAWLSLGSQGRKEQLLMSDQDNILVFEDVPADKYRDVKDYFLKMAKRTTEILEYVGYQYCSNGHNANNINCCRSFAEWSKQYIDWINFPPKKADEKFGIFLDFEFAVGDRSLAQKLTDLISKNIKGNKKLYAYLGTQTLKSPTPLSFFKNFNLDEDGDHKGLFDLKSKAILPLVDAARVLSLSFGIEGTTNTFLRFKELAYEDAKHTEIFQVAADNYMFMNKLRTLEGIKNGNDGQFINLDDLSKAERETLKNSFHSMKDLEEIIKNRFQLTYFS